MKITKFDKQNLALLTAAINNALAPIAKEFGLGELKLRLEFLNHKLMKIELVLEGIHRKDIIGVIEIGGASAWRNGCNSCGDPAVTYNQLVWRSQQQFYTSN